jgi:hypothetical protein
MYSSDNHEGGVALDEKRAGSDKLEGQGEEVHEQENA